jgi:DHA2 family multidrug resistance protein
MIELVVAIAGFYYFFAHSLTTREPFVRFALFKDRNFVVSCIFMAAIGVVLFGTMALMTPFLQNLSGYPVVTAGWLLATRGVGTLAGMIVVGRLMRTVEAKYLILTGLCLTAVSLYEMISFTDQTPAHTIIVINLVQGLGLGLFFIPLSTVAFFTLPAHLRTDGTAMLTLVRNMASSIGISVMIANLTNKTTAFHSQLAEHITPFNDALRMPDVAAALDLATAQGRALMDALLTQQAAVIAYINDFKLLLLVALVAIPFVLVIGNSRAKPEAVEQFEV